MLFTFPSRYWSTIGHRRVFRLGGWSPLLPTGFHVSGGTRVPARQAARIRVRGCNPVPPALPGRSASAPLSHCRVGRPHDPGGALAPPVWPAPRSLAATRGISFDFSSSGYLDVSVPRVAPRRPMCSAGGRRGSSPRRVRPFGDPRVRRACAPNRGLSQLVTSFVGSLCQGIRRVPLPSCLPAGRPGAYPSVGPRVRGLAQMRSRSMKKNIYRLRHAMRLSRYAGGEPSGPDAARLAARRVAGQELGRAAHKAPP